jgi:quinol monooxygenase YgiN
MSKLEVSARMTIRRGRLEGFKRQAAECIRQNKEKDTKTLRYDWFLSDDETECEIREVYVNADSIRQLAPNMAVKLLVHAVMGRAHARPAPARVAACGRRW